MHHEISKTDALKQLPIVSRKYIKLIDNYLAPYQLNSSLYYYILKLHDFGDLPQEKLVQLTGVNASNVTRAIQKLMDSQYVLRKENPEDRRGYVLSLTGTGKEMYQVISEALQKANTVFFAPLTSEEQTAFIATINKLSE
ncbi:MarR family winged helix-turn-helix transcriptional regulator [Enterococcus dongliensis]|uniref:MarR family winged helix-turn-helix transcriptional regulator n=1 Tax=Enterococcus dongliensis TaxID=2559925 RepID=UPI002890825D|nr:MarR family transcriptional regulator [Enterococcus dongliensis]MDT2602940.1 MarR family transcriptional regulator [Enterococcus dongliensis]MDT2645647.1 MarR family transcriptional regulator [Enterococcus dongliensis]MDT2673359.1 MarR family transcriptional regulator [Enterococcus dongliensis]